MPEARSLCPGQIVDAMDGLTMADVRKASPAAISEAAETGHPEVVDKMMSQVVEAAMPSAGDEAGLMIMRMIDGR